MKANFRHFFAALFCLISCIAISNPIFAQDPAVKDLQAIATKEIKKVKIVFNGAGGYEIILGAEGQWTDYAIPLSSISAATSLNEIWLQEFSGVGFTIYVDAMGLN